MRLLAFNEIYYRGGGNRYMIDCLNALESNSNYICLISNTNVLFPEDKDRLTSNVKILKNSFLTRNQIQKVKDKIPYNFYRILARLYSYLEPLFFLINIFLFIQHIKKYKPSFVWSFNGGYPASLASLSFIIASKIMKVPSILSIVSMPAPRHFFHEKYLDKILWKSTTYILVNCVAIKEAIINFRSAPCNKIRVVYNAIEPKAETIKARKQTRDIIIGFVSRLEIQKGALVLYEAFKQLIAQYKNIILIFVGSGDALDTLKNLVHKDNLSKKIKLLGHHDGDIHKIISTFDIFVLPSFWEGLPYVLIEALRAGKPVISTKVGGIPEIIEHKKEGILISPYSNMECKEAIEYILNNPKERKLMCKNSRKKFVSMFSLEDMKRNIKDIVLSHKIFK
jgi:glycosyltransferase involved in cell wall biosynthesis